MNTVKTCCAICGSSKVSNVAKFLFGGATLHNMNTLLNRDISECYVCYGCYVKIGTLSYLLHDLFSRRTVNERIPYDYTLIAPCCYMCKSIKNVHIYAGFCGNFMEYINKKLQNIKCATKYPTCLLCLDILFTVHKFLVFYNNGQIALRKAITKYKITVLNLKAFANPPDKTDTM